MTHSNYRPAANAHESNMPEKTSIMEVVVSMFDAS